MFQTKVVEKSETHISCSATFFFKRNRAVYVIMWKNIVELDRPQMMCMHIASWIPKATSAHYDYVM